MMTSAHFAADVAERTCKAQQRQVEPRRVGRRGSQRRKNSAALAAQQEVSDADADEDDAGEQYQNRARSDRDTVSGIGAYPRNGDYRDDQRRRTCDESADPEGGAHPGRAQCEDQYTGRDGEQIERQKKYAITLDEACGEAGGRAEERITCRDSGQKQADEAEKSSNDGAQWWPVVRNETGGVLLELAEGLLEIRGGR